MRYRYLTHEAFAPHDRLVLEGTVLHEMYVVSSGGFAVTSLARGIAQKLTAGMSIGEGCLLRRRPIAVSVVAEMASETAKLDEPRFLQLVTDYPQVHYRMCKYVTYTRPDWY